jgi:tRNA dimethylallyltransferase
VAGEAGRMGALDEILARDPLRVEERGEVGVVDARVRAGCDLRLGAVGDAKAGGLQHREVVGAVADGQRIAKRKAHSGGDVPQGAELGVMAEDRLDDFAGQLAVNDRELVGAVLVGANPRRDRAGELAKAARHDDDARSAGPHRPRKRARAGVEPDAVSQHIADDARRQAGEQRDALAQRRLERDLAPHRALGDRGDAIPHAGICRELVDAFLADQRRIHVGDQEALQAMRRGLHNDVDRLSGERRLERGADRSKRRAEKEIGGDAFVEPAPGVEPRDALRRSLNVGIAETQFVGICDQRGDDGGGRHAASRRGPKRVRRVLLIAGATASGKSAAALKLAERLGALIVNADSMQVYADLRILTARPTPDEEGRAPHRLFGEIDGAVNYSVGRWARAARDVLAEAEKRPVIFVGGTGLYFRALTEGLSDVPPVPEALRADMRRNAEGRPAAELHAELAARDPESAARMTTADRQRVLRALEVLAATGRPLASFLGARAAPALTADEWTGLFLAPDRAELMRRIGARFDAMLGEGALGEVMGLMKRRLDPALPIMRAHGVKHLLAHLEGRVTLAEAAERSTLDTRHYAKRQFTWARRQLPGFKWVAPEEAEEEGMRALGRTWG